MIDKSKYTLEEKVAWLEGAFEQMDKRVQALERRRWEPAPNSPNAQARSSFEPAMIGTVAITTASFGLMGGIPFGIPGAIVGAVCGFALGVYSVTVDRRKRK